MNDENVEIPNAPSDDEIRAELRRTSSPLFWKPFGTVEEGNGFNGQPTDFSGLSPEAREKVLNARLRAGPGPTGTPYQHALWNWHKEQAALEKERDTIMARMTDVTYDPITGEGISKASADQMRTDSYRLSQVQAELERRQGPAGEIALERALTKAVAEQKARLRREYIQTEAKRRAAQSTLEEEIERAAASYRKGGAR